MNLSEEQFLEEVKAMLDAAVPSLRAEFSRAQITCSRQDGRGGGMVVLSALDLQAAGEACDLVELVVALVVPESGSPRIDANVCWGHPSGCVEGDIGDEGLEVSAGNFFRVVRLLPELIEILRQAIRRGKPVNNDSYEKTF